MEEIEEGEFGSQVEEYDGIKIKIQKLAAVKKHWSDCARKKQNFEHHVNGKKKKFDVYVASILWEKKKNDNGGSVVDYIETKHEETMQGVKDWLLEIKKQKTAGWSQHGVGNIGSSIGK